MLLDYVGCWHGGGLRGEGGCEGDGTPLPGHLALPPPATNPRLSEVASTRTNDNGNIECSRSGTAALHRRQEAVVSRRIGSAVCGIGIAGAARCSPGRSNRGLQTHGTSVMLR